MRVVPRITALNDPLFRSQVSLVLRNVQLPSKFCFSGSTLGSAATTIFSPPPARLAATSVASAASSAALTAAIRCISAVLAASRANRAASSALFNSSERRANSVRCRSSNRLRSTSSVAFGDAAALLPMSSQARDARPRAAGPRPPCAPPRVQPAPPSVVALIDQSRPWRWTRMFRQDIVLSMP